MDISKAASALGKRSMSLKSPEELAAHQSDAGKARHRGTTKSQRSELARKAVRARWSKKPLKQAK